MRTKYLAVCAGLVALTGVTALAQQVFVPPRPGIRAVEPYTPDGVTGLTRVTGEVFDVHLLPVKKAKVRIRNLATGRIEGETIANERGEYEFTVIEPSTYVVEMLIDGGYVVALSNAGSVSRYETLHTTVQLPGRWDYPTERIVYDQNLFSYFGVSAQTTLTAQTLELAIEQNVPPQDSGEPVSP
jgi:hypothetical protein